MSFFALCQPFLLVFLEFVLCCDHAEVHARPKEAMSAPGWFNSAEGFVIRNFQKQGTTEAAKILHVETENNDDDQRRTRKLRRKRKRTVKKVVRKFQNGDAVPNQETEPIEVKELKKRKKKRKGKRKFVKTVAEKNVESNLSESLEKNKMRKPVDIIVHIKMNE